MTSAPSPLGVRLFENLCAFVPKQTQDFRLALKVLLTTKQADPQAAMYTWVSHFPVELKKEVSALAGPIHLWTLVPILAWGYEQHWRKRIDLPVMALRHAHALSGLDRAASVQASTDTLDITHSLLSSLPKSACETLLNFWLNPERSIWLPDRLQAASMLVSRQAGAWEALATMASSNSSRGKSSSPSKRWSTHLQACMAVMPTNVQALYIEHFLDSGMSRVDMLRGARCAHASAWLKLSAKLLPLMPNNEWTRYDLLPQCRPSNTFNNDAAGQINRELAELYAPTLTTTLLSLTSDENWADTAFMRRLVDQTYRSENGLALPAQEAFALPDDLNEGLFV